MLLYFDTEFTGLRKDTDLISLGIIADNNKCFYAVLTDFDTRKVDDWIEEHVIANLDLSDNLLDTYDITQITGDKATVRKALEKWLITLNDDNFQLISDVSHYDMVLLIDLFGTAFDLPESINPVCYDICQDLYNSALVEDMAEAFDINREELLYELCKDSYDDIYDIGQQVLSLGEECKHNSLYDAIVIKALYDVMLLTLGF